MKRQWHSSFLRRSYFSIFLTAALSVMVLAQGGGGGGGTDVGDVFGDLIHIKRDPTTGQPILQKREVLLPEDVLGWAYCPIPVDPAGIEIPFLPLSCDPDPAYADSLVEVDYFGRLSGGRTKEANLRMHLDESILGIKDADAVTLDPAGRLLLGSNCTTVALCESWRTIDSPMENLSIYRWVMKYGHIQTDPAEEDTSPGGDPAEGPVYHPALDAADWAKFSGPVSVLLPRASSSQCFSGASFDVTCAAPQSLTSVDFFLAGSFLAGAADKTGRITPDLLQYLNRILKIPVDTPETLAALNTLPALIRDEAGEIAPATPGLPAPANERFVDFAADTYLRSDWFSKTVQVIQESGGVWVPTTVDLMTWLNFINGPMTTTAVVMPAVVASSNDSLRTVQFLHEYEIPADLWATPIATSTVVAPVVTGYSSVNQNLVLTATVTSQNLTAVSGSVTFSVRTAAMAFVGIPVTAPVLDGIATGTFVLPAGTVPQVLTIVAAFTPSGAFAASQGTGTLTVVLAPTITTVMPAGVPLSASPVDVALTATVSASPGDVVNEGNLLFTVRDSGNAVVGVPVSGPVSAGSATASFTVPGGLPAQRLNIVGAYQGTTHYAESTGSNQLAVGCLPLTILPAVLPPAVVGQPYTQTFTSDGLAPTVFSQTGTLPPGLSFVTDTIGGVPTTKGAFSFTIDVADAVGCTGSRSYTLDVQQTRPPLVYLDADESGDALTFDPSTGHWTRHLSQPDIGFAEQSQGTWAPDWSVSRADFNTDGLTDVFLHNPTTGVWVKQLNNGTTFTEESNGAWWPGWQKFVLDLDGDVISDLFLYDPATGQWYRCVSTPTGFSYTTGWWNPGWEITPMNLNGDAYGDLFLIDRTTGRWFWAVGEAGGFSYTYVGYWAPDWALYPGDFNGDGLGDLFLYRAAAGEYYVALNDGGGFSYTAGYGWAAGWTPYVGDLNGDGADDLFLSNPLTGQWFEMISGAVGFAVGGTGTWSLGWKLYPTDLNGDHRTDFLLYNPGTGAWYQARNLVIGSFSYGNGFWAPGLTIVTRAPIR